MSLNTYDDLVEEANSWMNCSPDTKLTLPEAVWALDKDLRRRGMDGPANGFMITYAKYIEALSSKNEEQALVIRELVDVLTEADENVHWKFDVPMPDGFQDRVTAAIAKAKP